MPVLPVFPKNRVVEVPETPSTNKLVEEILTQEAIPEGSVYYTLNQTAGIGQADNHWESEPGRNLTATIILRPEFLEAAEQFYLTIVLSLSVSDTVNYYSGTESAGERNSQRAQIKWPNDIYFRHRKIAGILIKNYISGTTISASVAGVGLNVNQVEFKEAPDAISLKIITGAEFDIKGILTKWHEFLAFYYEKLKTDKKSLLELYLSRLYMLGIEANYLIHERMVRAYIAGVDKHGLLVLNDRNGKKYVCGLKEIVYPPLG